MQPYRYRNGGRDLFVRMSYSNAPLLERLEVHYVDPKPKLADRTELSDTTGERARDKAEVIELGADAQPQAGQHGFMARVVGTPKVVEAPHDEQFNQSADTPVLLRQIADVTFAPALKRGDAGYEGKPAVILGIQKQPTADTIGLTESIEAALAVAIDAVAVELLGEPRAPALAEDRRLDQI